MRRRGRPFIAIVAVLSVAVVTGCAKVAGDGDVGGDWAVPPTFAAPVPVAGVCRPNSSHETSVHWDMTLFHTVTGIPCTSRHASETYYVAAITDAKAVSASTPPDVGLASFKPLYSTCVKQAESFLGGDYHRARVAIVAVTPTQAQWNSGSRYYHCEMLEIRDDSGRLVERTSSLKGGLRGSRPAAIGCANYPPESDYLANVVFVACSRPHLTEFTGIFTPPGGTYPGGDKVNKLGSAGCLPVGAAYVGMTRSALDAMGGYEWFNGPADTALWNLGDRSMRCYLGPYPERKITRSIKGRPPSQW